MDIIKYKILWQYNSGTLDWVLTKHKLAPNCMLGRLSPSPDETQHFSHKPK